MRGIVAAAVAVVILYGLDTVFFGGRYADATFDLLRRFL